MTRERRQRSSLRTEATERRHDPTGCQEIIRLTVELARACGELEAMLGQGRPSLRHPRTYPGDHWRDGDPAYSELTK